MNFTESLDYLFSLGYECSVKKFGLENSIILLKALGNPQSNFVKVQIAGTNGKGSTCAFLESICVEAGVDVGVNTSPHLVSVTERIRLNGVEISEEKFAECATKVRKTSEKLVRTGTLESVPTFFEHITAMSQLIFAEENIKMAILETGLGGRFDATTATKAEIVAFTPIDLDHTKTLGDTIEKIAAEKAAIIRPNTKVLSVPQKAEAEKVIYSKCREVGVEPIWSDGRVGTIEKLGHHPSCNANKHSYKFDLLMRGKHQRTNASLAIQIADALKYFGFKFSKREIEKGLEKARHKGRLEYWTNVGKTPILFDGAHNVSGARALRSYLEESVDKPITMIFAAMVGKNLDEISRILFPLAKHLILTTPKTPRSIKASDIARFTSDIKEKNKIYVVKNVSDAVSKAFEITSKGLILVTGSLYLIGEIQAFLSYRKVESKKA